MSQDKPVSDKRTEAEMEQRPVGGRAFEFIGRHPSMPWPDRMIAFAAQEVSLAVAAEREACAKALCPFCANPGEWSAAEKVENNWVHLYGERRKSVTSCAATEIHSRTEKGGK